MKAFLVLALISSPAFAAGNVCETYLPCGTFTGPLFDHADDKTPSPYLETVTITDLGDGSEHLLITHTFTEDGKTETYGDFRVVPRAGQAFDIFSSSKGTLGGTGSCGYGRCTYGSIPQKDTVGSWAGIFSFQDDQLTRSMVIQEVNGNTEFSVSRMKKE